VIGHGRAFVPGSRAGSATATATETATGTGTETETWKASRTDSPDISVGSPQTLQVKPNLDAIALLVFQLGVYAEYAHVLICFLHVSECQTQDDVMKRPRARLAFLPLLLLWSACSGGSGSSAGPPDQTAAEDQTVEDVRISTQDSVPDLSLPDFQGKDLPDQNSGDNKANLDGALEVWSPHPCLSHEDCDDGYCVEVVPGSGEYFCTPACMEECPLDWVCKSVFVDGADPVSVCLPPGDTLCKVCQEDADCLLAGSLCIAGSGVLGFCGRACNWDNDDCPEGFACTMAENEQGDPLAYQCLPEPGACCVGGDFASCEDDNPCTFEGCDASLGCTHLPVDEECTGSNPCMDYFCESGECVEVPIVADDTLNHIDDDCDGLTDEEAYKEFRLVAGHLVDGAGTADGPQWELGSTVGGPPVFGVSSDDAFTVRTGLLYIMALLGME
jgi:hypothetical protein